MSAGFGKNANSGPARIGPILGLPASTVHRILTRYRLNRLAWLDRPTGEVIRRYENSRPGELVHVDIKMDNKLATTSRRKNCHPVIGYAFIHSAVDGHSRLAYSEVLADERQHTTIGFWQRANAFFAGHRITVERVMTDNGSCYKSKLFTQALTAAGITPKRPTLPAADERQGRTLQLHTPRGMGLPTALRLQRRADQSPGRLPPHLQPPPLPHRTQRTPTDQPC